MQQQKSWRTMPVSERREFMRKVMQEEGNMANAARRLGLTGMAVAFRLKALGLKNPAKAVSRRSRNGWATMQDGREETVAKKPRPIVFIQTVNVYQQK